MPYGPEDEAFIRQLIEETAALPKAKMPTSYLTSPLAVVGYERKSPLQYDQDMRRKHFLEKVNEEYGDNPAYLPVSLQGPLVEYRSGQLDGLDSPRQFGSVGRTPLLRGAQWYASLPAVAYNTGKVIGNQITPNMYPEAGENLARAANTLTLGLAEDAGAVPRGTGTIGDDYNAEIERRGNVPWYQLSPRYAYDKLADDRQASIDEAVPAGSQYLQSLGVTGTPAMIWGGVMDSMLDPFTQTAKTLKLARTGGRAMANFLGDHLLGVGLPAGAAAATSAPLVYEQVDQLLNRLQGADQRTIAGR